MRIFVTGGTGFLGSHLTNRLTDLGHEVIITGVKTEQSPRAAQVLEPGFLGIRWQAVYDIDILFHLAANNDTQSQDRAAIWHANVTAPVELFEHCRRQGCRHYVYASSCAVYGNQPAPFKEHETPAQPLNHYAHSKAEFEKFARQFARTHRVNAVGLRYSNVFGPGEGHKGKRASMIHQLTGRIKEGGQPRLFKHGEQRRDWIYVDDAIDATLAASEYKGEAVFNCGAGESVTFLEIVGLIGRRFGVEPEVEWIDNPYEGTFQAHTECAMERAKTELGFRPKYTIRDGIDRFLTSL